MRIFAFLTLALPVCGLVPFALAAPEGGGSGAAAAVEAPARQPPPGQTLALALGRRDTRRIYAATTTGLLVTADGGQHWRSISLPPAMRSRVSVVACDPIDEQLVYVGGRSGLWRSEDGGASWRSLPSAPPAKSLPSGMAVGGVDPKAIYIATERDGMFRSDDGGRTWNSISSGLPQGATARPEAVRSLAVDPGVPRIAYAATETEGVYKTSDGGASWLPANRGLGRFPIAYHLGGPYLLMSSADSTRLLILLVRPVHSHLVRAAVFQSSDAGGHWFSLEAELPSDTRAVGLVEDPSDSNRVLVFTSETILSLSWKEIKGVETP